MTGSQVNLPEFASTEAADHQNSDFAEKSGADLEPVFDVPVQIAAVLGKTRLDIASLLALKAGSVLELDRRVGEAIDIYVNNRLVARGEVVMVEDRLGITMTEIIQDGDGTI
jgi:flagellar motor switch protein FliN